MSDTYTPPPGTMMGELTPDQRAAYSALCRAWADFYNATLDANRTESGTHPDVDAPAVSPAWDVFRACDAMLVRVSDAQRDARLRREGVIS